MKPCGNELWKRDLRRFGNILGKAPSGSWKVCLIGLVLEEIRPFLQFFQAEMDGYDEDLERGQTVSFCFVRRLTRCWQYGCKGPCEFGSSTCQRRAPRC